MAYYAQYDSITTADKSNDPDWIEITEAQYWWLFNGMLNGRQVWIKDGQPALRTPQPWDWDGSNYTYNEETDEWDPVVPEPEEGE